MRACGALACAARARGAAVVVCHKWSLLTASVLVPLLQGGSDQDFVLPNSSTDSCTVHSFFASPLL